MGASGRGGQKAVRWGEEDIVVAWMVWKCANVSTDVEDVPEKEATMEVDAEIA